jgi:hypothetical protein
LIKLKRAVIAQRAQKGYLSLPWGFKRPLLKAKRRTGVMLLGEGMERLFKLLG